MFVRPKPEYYIQAASPCLRRESELLEKVQITATKLIPGIANLSCDTWLTKRNLGDKYFLTFLVFQSRGLTRTLEKFESLVQITYQLTINFSIESSTNGINYLNTCLKFHLSTFLNESWINLEQGPSVLLSIQN